MTHIELFSGCGGIQTGMRMLGIGTRGFEFWPVAVKSATTNGHASRVADVSLVETPERGTVDSVSGGPPCQGFSAAGKGEGRRDAPIILEAATLILRGESPEEIIPIVRAQAHDHRSALVLEPLRWIVRTRPRAFLLEQVPAVLPLWKLLEEGLSSLGYSAKAGVLNAEQYGVPQTRRRAVVLGSLDVPVTLPTPTHSRYYSNDRARLDPGVPRWVTMAEALQWGTTERPSFTVTGGGSAAGGAEPYGRRARAALDEERQAGRWSLGDRRMSNGTVRSDDEPAPTLTGQMDNGNTRWALRSGNQASSAVRDQQDEPAATLVTGGRVNAVDWVQRSNYSNGGTGSAEERGRSLRAMDEPSVSMTGKPGHWSKDGSLSDAIRITVEEALILQSFPQDYVICGKRQGDRFQQVGNAMPPLLAKACGAVLFR